MQSFPSQGDVCWTQSNVIVPLIGAWVDLSLSTLYRKVFHTKFEKGVLWKWRNFKHKRSLGFEIKEGIYWIKYSVVTYYGLFLPST